MQIVLIAVLMLVTATVQAQSVHITAEYPEYFEYGSGVLIDKAGGKSLVLSCGHIFRGGRDVKLTVNRAPARLIGYELTDTSDLSLIVVDYDLDGTPVKIGPAPRAGDQVSVYGYGSRGQNFRRATGVIKSDTRWVTGGVRHGDSGAAVASGMSLVGIVSTTNDTATSMTRSGEISQFVSHYCQKPFG